MKKFSKSTIIIVKQLMRKTEIETIAKQKKWWDEILPRKGSYLRQRVLMELREKGTEYLPRN